MSKESKFYNALNDVFIGAEIEGESGFINLMRIKSRYYQNRVFPALRDDIEEKLAPFPEFKDELFDKLYDFFNRYFSRNGSIYFNYTPFHKNVYEKVYSDDKDVALFWKTHMLYYVKTDCIFRSLPVEVDEQKFFFDVSQLQHKKANEKRELVYEFKEKTPDNTLHFSVTYSEKGRKTKIDEIQKNLRKEGVKLDEEVLKKAFRIFEKQNEVDFFINKDAKNFLQEQFDLWMYQYIFKGETEWDTQRIKQLQALKEIAFKVIDFIAQFEDELVKIWNKPKFVLNSDYVITLDRIAEQEGGIEVIEKLINHKGIEKQRKEWADLDFVAEFDPDKLFDHKLDGPEIVKAYRKLPIDTKYFDNDIKMDLLSLFDNLDQSIDGWLIHSENYQALNTILPKFKEKVQTCYIDPPFNLGANADFLYNVNYKDSSWITLLENRLDLTRDMMNDKASIFLRCDYNGNMYVRSLMDNIFHPENFRNEIIVNRFKRQLKELTRLNFATESLFWYGKTTNALFKDIERARTCTFCGNQVEPEWRGMSSPGLRKPPERKINGRTLLPPKGRHWTFTQNRINALVQEGRIRVNENIRYTDIEGNRVQGLPEYLQSEGTPIDSNWTDVKGYKFGSDFSTENAEELLQRAIEIVSVEGDLVLDYFLGSATTTAVAHKLGRKWLGVELGEQFNSVVMPRMKKVLAGDKSGISKEKDVNWQGGGFFKYYDLEQYEDTLKHAQYEDTDLFNNPKVAPYNQYVFMKDKKMLDALEVDYENNRVDVKLDRLYDNIDIAETLSNLTGKWIKRISKDAVTFEDGQEVKFDEIDYKLVKPLIWW